MYNPLVTIIIPSYNHGLYLDRAIISVLNQSYKNIELIIADDGSKDNSHDIASKYGDRKNVTLFLNEKNKGQSAVINQALAVAKGEFISFLPSDDWYVPEKTEWQIAKFQTLSPDYGVVYGKGLRFDEKTGETQEISLPMHKGYVLKEIVSGGNFVYPITPMFRRECLAAGIFDERYKAQGEAIYNIVAIDYKFDYVDEVVGVMRNHGENTGKDPDLRVYRDSLVFWSEFFARKDIPNDVRKLQSRKLSFIHNTKGLSRVIYHREFSTGRELLIEAAKARPSIIFDLRFFGGFLLTIIPSKLANRVLDKKYG